MFYVLSWSLVAVLLALWSMLVWALHAVAGWTVSNAGALSDVATQAAAIRVPDWLTPWVSPEWVQLLSHLPAALGPWIGSLLEAVPSLAGVLTVVAWVLWSLGGLLLLALGVGLHVMIVMWRRRSGAGALAALRSVAGGRATPMHR